MPDVVQMDDNKKQLEGVESLLRGVQNTDKVANKTWNDIISKQIGQLVKRYGTGDESVQKILQKWHENVTIDYKYDPNFTPHINGFYMIFMVHGPWYESYKMYVQGTSGGNAEDYENYPTDSSSNNEIGLSEMPNSGITFDNPSSYFNMMATDIDVPDITEEYTSVSSRLRNSFVPSRNYFVSDFSISYIESLHLDVIRYHEAWHKYLNLIKRGEITDSFGRAGESPEQSCQKTSETYFVGMPYSNAVWVAVFKPFTTDIQLLIKLMGVMPVTMPLKQVVGNRSQSKMTVLNMTYKAADIFYKFYNGTSEFLSDEGLLAKSFREEVMFGTK